MVSLNELAERYARLQSDKVRIRAKHLANAQNEINGVQESFDDAVFDLVTSKTSSISEIARVLGVTRPTIYAIRDRAIVRGREYATVVKSNLDLVKFVFNGIVDAFVPVVGFEEYEGAFIRVRKVNGEYAVEHAYPVTVNTKPIFKAPAVGDPDSRRAFATEYLATPEVQNALDNFDWGV